MKRIAVLLSFLLLVSIAILGSGNNAFANHQNYTPPPPEVVIVVCSVVTPPTGTPPLMFAVSAFSPNTNTTITPNEDCATALVALKGTGLVIKDIQVLTSSSPAAVVYTLVNGGD